MEIRLDKEVRRDMEEAAKESFPEEAAGILLGRREGEKTQVEELVEAENVLSSSTKFEIDPQKVFDVSEEVEEEDRNIVGFFHSHPGLSPNMSDRDKKFMKLWSDKIWVIAGTDDQGQITEIGAFTWKDGEFKEVGVRKV